MKTSMEERKRKKMKMMMTISMVLNLDDDNFDDPVQLPMQKQQCRGRASGSSDSLPSGGLYRLLVDLGAAGPGALETQFDAQTHSAAAAGSSAPETRSLSASLGERLRGSLSESVSERLS